jgi:hypothetical protein
MTTLETSKTSFENKIKILSELCVRVPQSDFEKSLQYRSQMGTNLSRAIERGWIDTISEGIRTAINVDFNELLLSAIEDNSFDEIDIGYTSWQDIVDNSPYLR